MRRNGLAPQRRKRPFRCAMRVWRTFFQLDLIRCLVPAGSLYVQMLVVSRPSRASFFRYADSKLLPISTLVAVATSQKQEMFKVAKAPLPANDAVV